MPSAKKPDYLHFSSHTQQITKKNNREMKNEELHDFLTGQSYSYERDSEYNRDVYTNGNVMVEGQKSI